jgi:drug/metabolite transporter (DMT)-like permease
MLLIILAILSSAGILICFKSFEKYKIEILPAIVINYIIAGLLGYILSNQSISLQHVFEQDWLYFALLIGILFIIVFFIIGKSAQKAGIAITGLASKMSFVIPIMFSILYFKESVNSMMLIGFTIAISSIVLAVYKPSTKSSKLKHIWLPISLFAGAGLVDTLVKYSQETFLTDGGSALFSLVLFAIAAVAGFISLYIKNRSFKELVKLKTIIGGSLLGIVNFGSLYYLIAALNSSGFKSSIVFSMVNIGIVALSLIFGLFLYKEKISKLNYLGIALAFIAIIILAQ